MAQPESTGIMETSGALKPHFLSVIIPAYNEDQRLPATLERICTYLLSLQRPFEVIVVDDGSTDSTAAIVRKFSSDFSFVKLISYSPNRGKGNAVRTGVEHATASYVLFTDADLSTPIEELGKFLPCLEQGAAVVIGTRKHVEAQILQHQPLWREQMGKGFTAITNLLLGLDITDFTCGFKGFQTDAARGIFRKQTLHGWAFDAEILFIANRQGYSLKEVPVRWTNAPDTKVRIVRDTIISFLSLLLIRWNGFCGKYGTALPPDQPINAEESHK